ncbi:Chitinase 1 [Datura stramonium]|uniref:chitinase n=1 Tax=Datura stramonium TaxID=4076 RepID=A0ABS8UQC5_DATST|nr:Chitinase 1 [Datura stramonium]
MLPVPSVLAEQCGKQAGGALCPLPGYCCSNAGFCGTTGDYCDPHNCQSQCPPINPPPPPPSPPPPFTPPPPATSPDITEIVSSELFEEMLLHRNDQSCPARGFYTYDGFVQAARDFPGFATSGDITDRKREVAAFLAHTSHVTTDVRPDEPNSTYTLGYCLNSAESNVKPEDRPYECVESAEWPCAPGKKYYGRGPILISYNINYGPCGVGIEEDLLGNPDLVETDTVISFKSAIWFWMTQPSKKPSCHDVMVGKWAPSPSDLKANRLPGFGVTINIFNGNNECGHGHDDNAQNRIGFYKWYCQILGVSPGENIDCDNQTPFPQSLLLINSM